VNVQRKIQDFRTISEVYNITTYAIPGSTIMNFIYT